MSIMKAGNTLPRLINQGDLGLRKSKYITGTLILKIEFLKKTLER